MSAGGGVNKGAAAGRQGAEPRIVIPRYGPRIVIPRYGPRNRAECAPGNNSDRRFRYQNRDCEIRILLCGSAEQPLAFGEYRGFWYNDPETLHDFTRRGYIRVPLFDPTTDEEVCRRFREKLQSIVRDVKNCEMLHNDRCRLMVHFRIGDLKLFEKYFKFDERPGPRLDDFNLLLDRSTYRDGRRLLQRFFTIRENPNHMFMYSSFMTEKNCGSHETIEAFLEMRSFEAVEYVEHCISMSLNGKTHKFELFFGATDLKLQSITMITDKWNLDLVTAKGSDFKGTFREKADFRLQFDTSFASNSTEKVYECLVKEGFQLEELQNLFERVEPGADLTDEWETTEQRYRLRQPHLARNLEYVREQKNHSFVQQHGEWPFN